MSSNSFEAEAGERSDLAGPVRALLARSLDGIRHDVPAQHRALGRAVEGLGVQLQLDHEKFSVRADEGAILLGSVASTDSVVLATSARTVVSLLDGELDLLDAIVDDAVTLTGSVEDLLRFDDALLAYLHGAVRSPGSSQLLVEFRALSEKRSPAM